MDCVRTVGPRSWHMAPGIGDFLRALPTMPNVVSIQNVWLGTNWSVGRWASQHRIPYMITIHGNLNSEAQKYSPVKKRIARWLFFDSFLRQAKCLQASNEGEYRAIRRFGLTQPICVLANGIELPPTLSGPDIRRLLGVYQPSKRVILYFGRLHPIKNIASLIRAWQQLAPRYPSWKLVIAGDGAEKHKGELASLAAESLRADVEFVGYVEEHLKSAWLSVADIFVLPSFSEAFAMAPLEAMAHGTPVLLTSACNFPEVEAAGAGKVTGASVAALQGALDSLLSLQEGELANMGLRARELVQQRFTWDFICMQLEDVYAWMQGESDMPDCVWNG